MMALLPLMLVAAPVANDGVRSVGRIAVASVTIIRAEPVEVEPRPLQRFRHDRQYRQRAAVPIIDFF